MNKAPMTSLERVLTALSQKEPDRVPLFLLLSLHGARFAGLSIEEYFRRPDRVAEAQLAMRERYRNDCFYTFFYAAIEAEAFGGEAVFYADGPPNAGAPPLRTPGDIDRLAPPAPDADPRLQRVLETQRLLKAEAGDEVPIIGVVMGPFSLPVMQLGFEAYLQLMFEDRERFRRLMAVNSEFCAAWANAQLAAGATAICYFNPVSSATVLTRGQYLEYGFETDRATLARIQGPTATHTASGRALPLVDDYAATGTAVLGVSADESLAELKARAAGRLTLLGNLNGIAMRHWTPADAEREVKGAIAQAGPGGGFVLADNHGEIPWQVTDETLLAIADAVEKWGRYPLEWIDPHGG